jgi:hypothetical protein
MNQWVLTRAAVLGGLILVACGPKTSGDDDGAAATQLAALAEDNVERALRGTVTAGGFVANSTTLANSLGFMGGESCTDEPCVNGVCPPSDCVKEHVTTSDLQETRADMNASIDSMLKTLREQIFTKENLESESNGSAIYRLGPNALCGAPDAPAQGSSSGGPAPQSPSDSGMDPNCVDLVNRLEVRLRLSSAGGDNVDVAVLLTPDRRNPATLELHTDHAGVVVNLGEIKGTLDALGEDTGSLVSLAGKLDFEIKRNAELDYSFLASVLEDVEVGVRQDFGDTMHVGVGKSVPTFELRFDGKGRTVTGTLDVGAITLEGPLNAFRDAFDPEEYDPSGNPVPRPVYQGTVEGMLAGLEAGVTLDGSSDKITLDHVGLGDQTSTLKVDQNVIAALDVNPAAGRHFDLLLDKQQNDTLATFTPTLDVSLLLKFAPLLAQIPDLSPGVLDNTLHLWFDGTNPSVQTGNDELRVVNGTLHYTDAHDPSHDMTANAGSCVRTSDAESGSGFVVASCP